MVQIQINNMMAIIKMLVFLLPSVTCVPIPGNQGVMRVRTHQTEGDVSGNLKLYYIDGTDLTINYESLNLDCTMKNLPDKIITRVVATSVNFILHSKINWRGEAFPVSPSETEIQYPQPKLRSIEQPGCPWP